MMSVGPDNKVVVEERLLSLRFGFRAGTIYVEEEIFDDNGEILECVFQVKGSTPDGYVWTLSTGTFKVYGLSHAQMSESTVLLTPPPSTSTVQVPGLASVKIEPSDNSVHLLSDSDDDTHSEIKLGDTRSNPFQSRGSQDSGRPSRQGSRSSLSASLSTGPPPIHPTSKKTRSIMFSIRLTASRRATRSA